MNKNEISNIATVEIGIYDRPTYHMQTATSKDTNKVLVCDLEAPKPYYIIIYDLAGVAREPIYNVNDVGISLFRLWILDLAKQALVTTQFKDRILSRKVYTSRWDAIAILSDVCVKHSPLLFSPTMYIYETRGDALRHWQGLRHVSLDQEKAT